jgi:stage II sporulation protein D
MRMNLRSAARQCVLWAAVFAALLLLFQHFSPTQAEASSDEELRLTVLTDAGPTSMTMADYLPCAVAAEMPVSFGAEALKAQAVAARTYVLAARRHQGADVCTDSGCCLAFRTEDELRALWGADYDEYMNAVASAVKATDGEILVYNGEPILAAFHASSAGRTEDSAAVWSAQPYLVAVDSPETPDSVPGLVTSVSFAPEELTARLGLTDAAPPDAWLSGAERDSAGRVKFLRIAGQSLSGAFVRKALGLRSTDFSVRYAGGVFIFTVSGYGHGVGMSQEGAKLLAADGQTYDQILAHYYPGTQLLRP